jgi:DNA repair protein RadD
MITLRPYQQAAIEAVYRYLRDYDDNPCIVLPTAAGKTPCIARICKDAVGQWEGRILVLAHVKELLQQSVDKLRLVCPEIKVGVYSAGLRRRDTENSVIVAGIQSVHQRADELGHFDLVLVDEAHLIPADGEGTYRTFLADLKRINPNIRVVGLTATPFRLKTGPICGPENVLNTICYEVGVRELMDLGYLCRLRSKAGKQKVDTDKLHVRGGEFIASEVETLMDDEELVEAACREIVERARERKSCLVFASGVEHGRHVAKQLKAFGQNVETVFGDTLDFIRDQVLADFRAGQFKFLVNVNVLTTGFDAPNVDCVVLLRPTLSPGLYYQMVGRGFRLHPEKTDCLVLDFGGNVLRHGPVDAIRPRRAGGTESSEQKECPQCQEIVAANCEVCPGCGYEWPGREQSRPKHTATPGDADIVSCEPTVTTYPVMDVFYTVHHKRGAAPEARRTVRVDYRVGWQHYVSEWICVEHAGYAREKAQRWWSRRSHVPAPRDADQAVQLARAGALCATTSITVRSDPTSPYDRISHYELGSKPDYREPGWEPAEVEPAEMATVVADDDIPF